jgi:hypothetical protein
MNQKQNQTAKSNSAEEYLSEWMKKFVEKPHPLLGNMPPCPFARKARLRNRIKIVEVGPAEPNSRFLELCGEYDFDKVDVLMMVCDPARWSWEQTFQLRVQMNEQLKDRDIVILEDHPDYKETVAGIPMSNGRYCILFAQRLSRMNDFSKKLKETTDYYDHWSESELADVVIWRDPESWKS